MSPKSQIGYRSQRSLCILSVMGATEDRFHFSDDEIEAMLTAASGYADLGEAADVAGFISDVRNRFASQPPIVGPNRPVDPRPDLQGQVLVLNEIIDRLVTNR